MANINNINLAVLPFDKIRKLLSPEEIERVYQLRKLEYAMMDVEAHVEDLWNEDRISSDELDFLYTHREELAIAYLDKYQDCNLAENDVYESMILNFIEENYR